MSGDDWSSLIARLDRAGVPQDPQWRGLVLFLRNMRSYHFLTERQQEQMQVLIVDTLRGKSFTPQHYEAILRRMEEILLDPYKEKVRMAMEETRALLDDVRSLLMRKKGDVENLESTTVNLVEQEANPQELIASMRKAFKEVVNDMEQDMANLTQLSMTDQLTRLFNRRAFDELLRSSVDEVGESGESLALIMLDIDHFKRFNDTYGHSVGDQALRLVGAVLKTCGEQACSLGSMRCHPCRYGGEEFAVILPGSDLGTAFDVAENIREAIAGRSFVVKNSAGEVLHSGLKVTVSLGVEEYNSAQGGDPIARLVEAADRKLYQAKKAGRNRVCHLM
ncbi:MAG: GGDEF domain-containing protein [Desulfovibrionaceae bacterium]